MVVVGDDRCTVGLFLVVFFVVVTLELVPLDFLVAVVDVFVAGAAVVILTGELDVATPCDRGGGSGPIGTAAVGAVALVWAVPVAVATGVGAA